MIVKQYLSIIILLTLKMAIIHACSGVCSRRVSFGGMFNAMMIGSYLRLLHLWWWSVLNGNAFRQDMFWMRLKDSTSLEMDGKNETILNLFMNKHSLQWVWNSESDEDKKKLKGKWFENISTRIKQVNSRLIQRIHSPNDTTCQILIHSLECDYFMKLIKWMLLETMPHSSLLRPPRA